MEDFVSKRLVICCDGTWNTPDQADGGRPAPTNVAKVALSVSPSDHGNVEQRVYYQHGVGVSRWEHIRGGAFGFGLSRNVREAYRFIVENYKSGDELYFFGFSRGAFTARSVVGLIRNAGVLRRENAARIDEAYALYRDRAVHPNDVESQLFRRSYSVEPRIRFIGVWDTVAGAGKHCVGGAVHLLVEPEQRVHQLPAFGGVRLRRVGPAVRVRLGRVPSGDGQMELSAEEVVRAAHPAARRMPQIRVRELANRDCRVSGSMAPFVHAKWHLRAAPTPVSNALSCDDGPPDPASPGRTFENSAI